MLTIKRCLGRPIHVILFLALWCFGSSMIVTAEDYFIKSVQQPILMASWHYANQNGPPSKIDTDTKEKVENAVGNVEIIRNSFLALFCMGGCLLGGGAIVLARRMSGREAARMFSLCVFTGAGLTFITMRMYSHGWPEEAIAYGFIITALVAYPLFEVALVLGGRVKKAAEERGWVGVTKEIWGVSMTTVTSTNQQTTSTTSTAPANQPATPEPPK